MKLKRIMAAGLAATLAMSSPAMIASAQTGGSNGTLTGPGELEGVVDTDIYNVVLPTTATNALKYIADPQKLIEKTDGAAHTNKTFGEGTLFFANAAGSDFDYSNKSDALKVENKSSKAIKLTVAAKATVGSTGTDAKLAASDTLSATDAEVYLAITDGTTTNVLQGTDSTITQVLGAAPETAYEYKYDSSSSKYSYGLKADVSSCKFAEYSVYLTGAASENGWEDATTLPEISVVWTAAFAGTSDSVTINTPAQEQAHTSVADVTLPGSGVINVPVTLGTDGAVPVKVETDMYGTTMDLMATDDAAWCAAYDSDSKQISFGADVSAWMIENATTVKAATFTVTFDKGDSQSFSFK